MKRVYLISTLAVICLCGWTWAAQRKAPELVTIDALVKETQRTALPNGPTQGMNFVWYVPTEFWHSALAQNKELTKQAVDSTVESLNGLFIVCVVRAQIQGAGEFVFYDDASVLKNLTVEYADKAGKVRKLQPKTDLNPTAESILAAMKPMLKGAMGNMGQNMYFFVFSDVDAGKRLVNPLEAGKLTVTLAPLKGETGGKAEMLFPLNALFQPRECAACHQKDMDIRWGFCPHCGTKLKE